MQSQLSPEGAIYKNENGICGESGGYAQAMRWDIALEIYFVEDSGKKAIRNELQNSFTFQKIPYLFVNIFSCNSEGFSIYCVTI